MGKWTYVFLNVIFFLPVLVYAGIKYKTLIKQERKFIFFAACFGFITFFIIDPVATYWQAWQYDQSQTLGIYFGRSNIEELIWAMLVCMITAVAIAAAVRREDKKSLILK